MYVGIFRIYHHFWKRKWYLVPPPPPQKIWKEEIHYKKSQRISHLIKSYGTRTTKSWTIQIRVYHFVLHISKWNLRNQRQKWIMTKAQPIAVHYENKFTKTFRPNFLLIEAKLHQFSKFLLIVYKSLFKEK